MDTQRLILFFVFSFSLLLLWEAWQKELRPPVPATPSTQTGVPTPSSRSGTPAKSVEAVPSNGGPASRPRERPRVRTDRILAAIDTGGGNLDTLEPTSPNT